MPDDIVNAQVPEVQASIPQVTSQDKFVSDTPSLIEKADAVAKRIEDGNKKLEELVKRNEAIAARMMISGRADAGQVNKTPEEARAFEAKKQADEIANKFFRRR